MPKRTSSRKKRHEERRPPEDVILERVTSLAAKPYVLSVEGEVQGEWNLLAMWIHVAESTPDREIVELENELSAFLAAHFAEKPLPFTWSVGVWRSGKPVSAISPDEPLGWLKNISSPD